MSNRDLDQFIEEWGRMGLHWGVGKVMAEIQALLYLSPGPMSLDDLADRLRQSRSNISVNVRALQDLRVVRKVSLPGDRKDYYAAESDIARVARQLAGEKRRRELDPALKAVNSTLERAQQQSAEPADINLARLRQLKDLLEGISAVFDAFIGDAANESYARLHTSEKESSIS